MALRWLARLVAGILFSAGAQAANLVGACTPNPVDLGTLAPMPGASFVQLSGSMNCSPSLPVPGPDTTVDYGLATFSFVLAQPMDFYAYVYPSSTRPNQLLPYWSGVGIQSASLLLDGSELAVGFGRGIGAAEGPALLNPDFFGSGGWGALEPAGSYQILVRPRGFGPIPQGPLNVVVYASGGGNPVTPVPEPVTVALQLVGLGVLASVLARRRRGNPVAAAA